MAPRSDSEESGSEEEEEVRGATFPLGVFLEEQQRAFPLGAFLEEQQRADLGNGCLVAPKKWHKME